MDLVTQIHSAAEFAQVRQQLGLTSDSTAQFVYCLFEEGACPRVPHESVPQPIEVDLPQTKGHTPHTLRFVAATALHEQNTRDEPPVAGSPAHDQRQAAS
ncbi:hypothetical protein TW95_gp0437 [Pandoravirus inopinatum]|uniref:Uncharacterized protein n=1 Tax=Pandoravirus inopinatum TaxID=1605721 RepID=A0A0B5J8S8_9VIRU|nr:hypothetical protein TW95_gp0437 [Pandoravirus inopinatum]AJF97171.1 hypothetical protein [Pandoravirus inopinatum]